MHSQPEGLNIRGGPADLMLAVGFDVDMIPRSQGDFFIIFKSQPGLPFEDHHPFVLRLIIPAGVRRGMALRDNPLYLDLIIARKLLEDFFG